MKMSIVDRDGAHLRWISKDAGNENDAILDYDIGSKVIIEDDEIYI